jgi:hypothetical protein
VVIMESSSMPEGMESEGHILIRDWSLLRFNYVQGSLKSEMPLLRKRIGRARSECAMDSTKADQYGRS